MEIRGAGKIAKAAALALKELALNYDKDDINVLKDELRKASETLLSTRPTAISLENAINCVLRDIEASLRIEDLRENIARNADIFIENADKALDTIGEIGARRIKDGDVILTHCNSSAALAVILHAHSDGKKINVYATESRPKKQGYITVRKLADEGISVTLIVDSAVRYIMQEIDIVIVGADTIASNGAVINKIGTSQIALCAHEARVPVMICAETYKFSKETMTGELVKIEERDEHEVVDPAEFPGVKIFNPVFDATPAEYIDVIVTERGVISPYAAYEIIKEMEG
jgi:ribose 1,5-bisphosphate isomerase